MCVVYLMTDGQKLRKNGGRLEIMDQQKKLHSIPIEDVDSLVVGAKTQISTEAMYSLLNNKAQISYLDWQGNIIGCMGDRVGSLDRLLTQQSCFEDEKIAVELIRYTIGQKLYNQRQLLGNYASSLHKPALLDFARAIKVYEQKLRITENIEELRGFEGISSKVYFAGFGQIIDSSLWDWHGRNRRPPKDPVNSMLSYGYAFLEREVRRGIAGARLDSRIGFFHSNDGRKDSLVYDLMELFRQNVIDKFVLKVVNRKLLKPEDFSYDEELGCRFTDGAKRVWIRAYEEYMEQSRTLLHGDNWRRYICKSVEAFAERAWALRMLA